jgi:multiple sugar transport system permease protein
MGELFPILWVLITSFKIPVDIFRWPPRMVPQPATLQNYVYIFAELHFLRFLRNTVLIATLTTVICSAVSVPGAYAISRFHTGGRALTFWILVQRMIPPIALVIPLFLLFWKLRIMDTWIGVSIAHVAFNLPFAIWLMVGFFSDIPVDLEEAAIVDGCTRFQAFLRVSIPLVVPGLAAMAIFIAIQSWNEFFFAVILTNSARSQTLTVAIATLLDMIHDVLFGELCASAIIAMIPVFVFALVLQKYLVRGLTAGAVKG